VEDLGRKEKSRDEPIAPFGFKIQKKQFFVRVIYSAGSLFTSPDVNLALSGQRFQKGGFA